MKISTAIGTAIGFFAAMSCKDVLVKATNVIPLSVGEDFVTPFGDSDLLRGFKLNVAEGESLFKANVFEGEIETRPFATEFISSKIIQNFVDVTDTMGIEGSLAVSYGPMSGSGAGRFLESRVSTRNSVTLVFTRRSAAFAKSVLVDTLVPTAEVDGLKQADIADVYGTKFISEIIYGSQLEVRFTLTSEQEIDVEEIEAELKGKIGVGALSLEFEAKFEKKEGEERAEMQMEIEAIASGVNFAVPANPSFDDVTALIEEFNAEYEQTLANLEALEDIEDQENVLKELTPVGFTTNNIADHLQVMDKITAAALDARMAELEFTFFGALWKKQQLANVRYQNEIIYADPRLREEIFAPYAAEVDKLLSELEGVLNECIEYRRLPLDQIVGPESEPVPPPFGRDGVTDQLFFGLIGEAFIQSPLVLDQGSFQQLHYTGFAIPLSDGSNGLQPWLSGEARDDATDLEVARAKTPDELFTKVQLALATTLPAGAIAYTNRFHLSLERGGSGLLNSLARKSDSTLETIPRINNTKFDFKILSNIFEVLSKKDSECVKYGDLVFISQGADKFLRGTGNTVQMSDPLAVPVAQRAQFQWKVQSQFPIDGDIDSVDAKHGECVIDAEKIILQNAASKAWLNGNRGSSAKIVQVSDIFAERTKARVYQWTIELK